MIVGLEGNDFMPIIYRRGVEDVLDLGRSFLVELFLDAADAAVVSSGTVAITS